MAGRQNRRSKLEAEKRLEVALKRIELRKKSESPPKKSKKEIDEQRQRIYDAIDNPCGELPVIWRTNPTDSVDPTKISNSDYIAASYRAFGIVSVMARILGVRNATIYEKVNTSPTVKDAIAEAREGMLDISEARLFEAVANGAEWAVRFHLETIGKHRGYTKENIPLNSRGTILDAIGRMVDGEELE